MDKLPEIVGVQTLDWGAFVVDVIADNGLKIHWPVTAEESNDMLGAIAVCMNQWNDDKYALFKQSLLHFARVAARA